MRSFSASGSGIQKLGARPEGCWGRASAVAGALLVLGCWPGEGLWLGPAEALAAEAAFPQLVCSENVSSSIDKEGRVVACNISAPVTIGGLECAAGGWTELYPDGKLKKCKLAGQIKTGDLDCKTDVELYPSGKVKKCTFVGQSAKVSGIECKWRADLLESGELEFCIAATALTLQGIQIPADTGVILSQDGSVRKVFFKKNKPYDFKGHRCAETTFYPNGSVKMCQTAETLKVQGKETPLSVYLCFDEKGEPAKDKPDALCVDWNKLLN